MAEPQCFTEAQQDPTGILDAALAAGANIVSAEIDNRDARLTRLALGLEWLNTWASDTGVTNPLAGDDVASIRMSNGDSSGTATGKVAVLYDSET